MATLTRNNQLLRLVTEPGLVCALNIHGIRPIMKFQNPPEFKFGMLYKNTYKLRDVTRSFYDGTLDVPAKDYANTLLDYFYYEDDAVQCISYYATHHQSKPILFNEDDES